jgi:MoxR-like ATPase
VLIEEVDKPDIEFPNDLLLELDRMGFFVYETRKTIVARHRPVVIITSNNEKGLPDAFLRRCFFHYIRFPDRETMWMTGGVCGNTDRRALVMSAPEAPTRSSVRSFSRNI